MPKLPHSVLAAVKDEVQLAVVRNHLDLATWSIEPRNSVESSPGMPRNTTRDGRIGPCICIRHTWNNQFRLLATSGSASADPRGVDQRVRTGSPGREISGCDRVLAPDRSLATMGPGRRRVRDEAGAADIGPSGRRPPEGSRLAATPAVGGGAQRTPSACSGSLKVGPGGRRNAEGVRSRSPPLGPAGVVGRQTGRSGTQPARGVVLTFLLGSGRPARAPSRPHAPNLGPAPHGPPPA